MKLVFRRAKAMATKLGDAMRELRTEGGERLLDMAAKLNVSSAFLSAVEHGRKSPPTDLVERLQEKYIISTVLLRRIRKEVDAANTGVTIRSSRKLARDTAAVFARKVNRLPDDKLCAILNIMNEEN